ncbi:protein DMP9-like [Populus alba x Populus x berolinensis]|nr:protein DMP9-like [Populus alba x Populus x berolinensis]
MEQTPGEEIGIRIYTASPQNEPKLNKISTGISHQDDETRPSKPLCTLTKAPKEPGSKRRAVAKGMQKTISKTSMLVNFLPTGTLLTFEMLLPSISKNGVCTPVTALMIHALLGLCSLSCFFFHFTDRLAVFKPGLTVDVPKDERYRVGFTDFVHAIMSVMVFMAIALSDHREMGEVMESFPLMVGVICSCLFLVFPTSRHGIGCMSN